jgi:hypothetical protein
MADTTTPALADLGIRVTTGTIVVKHKARNIVMFERGNTGFTIDVARERLDQVLNLKESILRDLIRNAEGGADVTGAIKIYRAHVALVKDVISSGWEP